MATNPDLGGLNIPQADTGSNSGNDSASGDLSASAEVVRQRKQRSDKGKPRGTRADQRAPGVSPISPTQFQSLYSPEIWARTLSTPGDAMAAITGKKHWEISQQERESLGITGSVAAQCFAVTDPRWLAASLALLAIIDVYAPRIAKDLAEMKKQREEERKKKESHHMRGTASVQ